MADKDHTGTRIVSSKAGAMMSFDLQDRAFHPPTARPPLTSSQLLTLVADQFEQSVGALRDAVLELTARQPYQPTGRMDFFKPGRWDSTYNQVLMDSIVQTGPSPGMWDGTAGYGEFEALAAATYLLAVNFTGYQQTMRLNGPWGTNTAHTFTTSDAGTVTALWTSAAPGAQLSFTMTCVSDDSGYGIAALTSVQVFPVA
jgi:hypothetical protein